MWVLASSNSQTYSACLPGRMYIVTQQVCQQADGKRFGVHTQQLCPVQNIQVQQPAQELHLPLFPHMMFPLTCAALEALINPAAALHGSHTFKPTESHCCHAWSGLPWGSSCVEALANWMQKCICSTEHNQHFTLHLFVVTISFAHGLKCSHTHKSCAKHLSRVSGAQLNLTCLPTQRNTTFIRKSIKAISKRQDY